MGFFSNIATGFGFGGSSTTGRKSAEQIRIGNDKARAELEKIFGVSEAQFTDAQKQLRDDFLRERGLLEEQFQPFIEAGTRALGTVEEAGTVGGLDARINEILGSQSFQGLKAERIRDEQTQLAAGGLTRSGAGLERIAGISPDLAFQIENQLFGRNRDLANLGFQGVERRGQLGTQLTLGQGALSGDLTSLQEQLRGQFGGRVSDLISGTGRAASSGILADQAIDQQRLQNLINLVGTVTGGGGGDNTRPRFFPSGDQVSSGGVPKFGRSGAIPGGVSGIGEPLRGSDGEFFRTNISTGRTSF